MEWTDISRREHVLPIEGLDPYVAWLLGDGGRFSFHEEKADRLYPVIIELNGISIADFETGTGLFKSTAEQQRWRDSIALPPVFASPPTDIAPLVHSLGFTTAVVRSDFFALLRDPDHVVLRRAITSITLSRPGGLLRRFDRKLRELSKAVSINRNGSPSGSVVVGIIDDGIAFAHERFRSNEVTTRIASLWLQGPEASEDEQGTPTFFGNGRELSSTDINNLLLACSSAGGVDEDMVYSRAKVLDFATADHKSLAHRGAHGTHVLDIAAGATPGQDPQWPIVAVQLPSLVTEDTSGAKLTQPAVEGVVYILLESLRIAADRGTMPLPVVINLSYGFTAGPHDGSLPIERALETIVALWEKHVGAKVRVVLPAGNHYLSRMHAALSSPGPTVVELPWRIHPDDRTPSHVEIWLPPRPSPLPCPVRVSIRAAGQTTSSPVVPDEVMACELVRGDRPVAQVAYGYANGRGVIRLSVWPTYELDPPAGPASAAPAGVWMIRIENVSLNHGESVHAWIQRDDSAYGFAAAGRQSYFDDPCYERRDWKGHLVLTDQHDCPVKRAGTLNAIATGDNSHIIVVGGYVHSARKVADYSSSGPASGTRQGPDVLAVSDRSPVLGGILAAGTRSGSRLAMNGSSVAAPYVTRRIAAELAAGNEGDRAFVANAALLSQGEEAAAFAASAAQRNGAGPILPPKSPQED
jgi:hypothetical protein